MRKSRGIIVAYGDVTRFFVMTVTETARCNIFEVFGLKDGEDFDKVAGEFADSIIDGEYLEVETAKTKYILFRVEVL